MVLLETGTPGTSVDIYSEDTSGRTRTRISQLWLTSHPGSIVVLIASSL